MCREPSEAFLKKVPAVKNTFLLRDSDLNQAENGLYTRFSPHYNCVCSDPVHSAELKGGEAWYKRDPIRWYMEEYWDINKGS